MAIYNFESKLAYAIAVPISLGIILGWIAYEPSYSERERRGEPTSYTPTSSKSQAPSLHGTDTETTVYCKNTGEEITFFNGYDAYPYGDYVLLNGGNNSLGAYAGFDVVAYNKISGDYNYLCYSPSPLIYPPMVIQLDYVLEKEGTAMVDNEYSLRYAYFSATSNNEIEPFVYSATIGKYPIVLELAFDSSSPVVVGTYYYKKNGPKNRMIVHGERVGDNGLTLYARDPDFSDDDTERFDLVASGNEFSGDWTHHKGKTMKVTGRIR